MRGRRFNGPLLRRLRKRKGWTQANLGEELGGLNFTMISKWENYHEQPDEYRREQLAEIWPGVDFDEPDSELNANMEGVNTNRSEHEYKTRLIYPEKVSWGPANGQPAGVHVWRDRDDYVEEYFIPWSKLKSEILTILLPWISTDSNRYRIVKADYQEKSDWIVYLIDAASGNWYCDVWLGGDPDKNWDFDGLIRFGDANATPRTWIVFQRYSDGAYRKLHSVAATLEDCKQTAAQS